jgi:uncharacterized membrane protein
MTDSSRSSRLRHASSYALPAIVSAALIIIGFFWKAGCEQPGHPLLLADAAGRMCLTDITGLWQQRDMVTHQFPYVHAVFVAPQGLTGAVEYPVLNGMLIWLVGLGATNSLGFLTLNAVALGISAIGITLLLRRLAGRRVWLWAAAPALLLYVVYNWDAWTVLTATGALGVLAIDRRRRDLPSAATLVIAGLLLGLGGALKVYPLLLVLPLMLFVVHAERAQGASVSRRLGRAAIPAVAAGVVLIASNLPIMLISFAGWLTPISFQSHRPLSVDTLSIWYWLVQPFGRPESERILPAVNAGTLGVTAVAVVVLLVIGWRIAERRGSYPVLSVGFAVVAAYVVLGKVSSPQYLLWLIPLMALLHLRVRWIVALYAVDAVMYVCFLQMFAPESIAHPIVSQAFHLIVAILVFVRAALIVFLAVRALVAESPPLRAGVRTESPAALPDAVERKVATG